MSISKYAFFLVILTVAVKAKIILRAESGADTTGNYVVKLSHDTSSEQFHEFVEYIEGKSSENIPVEVDGKYITARLPEAALDEVS